MEPTSPVLPGAVAAPPKATGSLTLPLIRARGVGGRSDERPLYETTIDGQPYVAWDLADGRVACAAAVCPHKPALGPVLQLRGVVQGDDLRCTRHANLYSGRTGECIEAEGHGCPGRMRIQFGRREAEAVVINVDPEPSISNELLAIT